MTNKILLAIFLLTTSLMLADILTPIDINSLEISFILLSISLISGIINFGRAPYRWHTAKSSTGVILISVSLPLLAVFIWDGDWKTQSIDYQNRHSPNRVIEFQMRNPGAGSYTRRTIDKIKIMPGISWITEVDAEKIDTSKWNKVNIDVNELELKYP